MDLFYILLIGIGGLCLGSFFNVLIWRIPRGESVVWPSSHCTVCGHKLNAAENIPLFSYLFLRGRCSSCKEPISFVYPLIELLTAVALVLLWDTAGFAFDLPWYRNIIPALRLASLIMLIPISLIDLRHYIIPDRFTLPLLGLGLVLSILPHHLSPVEAFLGALSGGGSLLIMGLVGTYVLKKGDAMGMGDVKLMACMGALWGAKTALLGIMFGAFLGSIAGVVMILARKLDDDHRIPFGPFLGAGVILAILVGDRLLNAYLSLLGIS
ncbi:MAG: prepilin peptidase [Chitinispirillaceae bacterium]